MHSLQLLISRNAVLDQSQLAGSSDQSEQSSLMLQGEVLVCVGVGGFGVEPNSIDIDSSL